MVHCQFVILPLIERVEVILIGELLGCWQQRIKQFNGKQLCLPLGTTVNGDGAAG